MKPEESVFLYGQKRRDGYDDEEASWEVQEFRHSQKEFKKLNKECKKSQTKIRNLEKDNLKLKEKIKKLKEKLRNLKEYKTEKTGKEMFLEQVKKESTQESSRYNNGNLTFAKRLLRYVEPNRWFIKTELAKIVGLSSYTKIIPTLNFLVEFKLMEREKTPQGQELFRLK